MGPSTLVIHFIVPRIERQGGYEKQSITLAQGFLRRKDVALRIFTDSPPEKWSSLPQEVREHCTWVCPRPPWNPYFEARRAFKQNGTFAVVHLHALYRFSALILVAGIQQKLPVLLKLPTENDARILFETKRAGLLLFRPFLRRIRHFVCPSQALASEVRHAAGREDAGIYMPNAVDVGRFAPVDPSRKSEMKRRLNLPYDRVVLFVGRHVARKCGDVLIRAFARVQKSLPENTGVIFIGEGDQRDSWMSLARELGIGKWVCFMGGCDTPEVYYQAADAFILPSDYEGMPNVLLEAMASGLPSIATAIGGVTDIMQPDFDEFLVPPSKVDPLAEKMKWMFGGLDLNATGKRMRKHIEKHYSVDAVCERLFQLYHSLQKRS